MICNLTRFDQFESIQHKTPLEDPLALASREFIGVSRKSS